MAFIKLQFKPGVNRDQTDYSNEGGWYACDKIRFRSGYPQKIGGWVKTSPTAFIGVCRQMWNWITTYSDNLLALGTNEKVYIEVGGYFYDITTLRDTDPTLSTPDTDNSVETTNASTTVKINLTTNHNAQTGDYVQISGVAGSMVTTRSRSSTRTRSRSPSLRLPPHLSHLRVVQPSSSGLRSVRAMRLPLRVMAGASVRGDVTLGVWVLLPHL